MKKYVLAFDEGTASARAILFDKDAHAVTCAQHEIHQIYPHPGWVDQDPMDIYASQYAALTECIAKSATATEEIAAVGITNQHQTTVVWNKLTGKPVCNAIVWQCRRTSDICGELEIHGHTDCIREATAAGAAFLASLGVDFYRDRDELCEKISGGKHFTPELDSATREKYLSGWRRALSDCKAFSEEDI